MRGIKVLVIGGPTASGKTALSLAAASAFGGEVVSADSMQVYRGMDIGTAKPSMAERCGIPHHMMDIVDPEESFSVADYCARAHGCIRDIAARGHVPIVVGGTGLYISSLLDNVTFSDSASDPAYREELRALAAQNGADYLHGMLRAVDPKSADAIHPNNVHRVIRALECYHVTGVPKSRQDELSRQVPSPYVPFFAALTCDRAQLYARIDRRVTDMVEQGLFAEVAHLRDAGVGRACTSMQGIGYKEVLDCLDGLLTEADCIALIQKNSRNYAKRQLTWFRRENRYRWYDALDGALTEQYFADAAAFLQA